MLTWTTAAPAVSAAFLSSIVEVVEAFTIVLAVATVRGWRPAALGAMAGRARRPPGGARRHGGPRAARARRRRVRAAARLRAAVAAAAHDRHPASAVRHP